jgi:hypothetical protein
MCLASFYMAKIGLHDSWYTLYVWHQSGIQEKIKQQLQNILTASFYSNSVDLLPAITKSVHELANNGPSLSFIMDGVVSMKLGPLFANSCIDIAIVNQSLHSFSTTRTCAWLFFKERPNAYCRQWEYVIDSIHSIHSFTIRLDSIRFIRFTHHVLIHDAIDSMDDAFAKPTTYYSTVHYTVLEVPVPVWNSTSTCKRTVEV